jgi:hypothetical protein
VIVDRNQKVAFIKNDEQSAIVEHKLNLALKAGRRGLIRVLNAESFCHGSEEILIAI